MSDTDVQPKKKATRFITPVLALVAVLAIGLIGGVLIGKSTATAALPSGFNPASLPGGAPSGGGFGDITNGTIVSVDGSTITLELEDGSSVTVSTADDTTVTQTTDASVSDLAAGDEITVVGEADDDGNVTATNISEGARGFGGGMPPTGTSD
jgi:hypothetical protein